MLVKCKLLLDFQPALSVACSNGPEIVHFSTVNRANIDKRLIFMDCARLDKIGVLKTQIWCKINKGKSYKTIDLNINFFQRSIPIKKMARWSRKCVIYVRAEPLINNRHLFSGGNSKVGQRVFVIFDSTHGTIFEVTVVCRCSIDLMTIQYREYKYENQHVELVKMYIMLRLLTEHNMR